MISVNFYLDKKDKKGFAPIHLRMSCEGKQIKISTGQKVNPNDFDKETQRVLKGVRNENEINHYLAYLEKRAIGLWEKETKKKYTINEIKRLLNQFVLNYRENENLSILKEQIPLYGKPFTFIDLFAGAGGFSEGFLQAGFNNKYFDFVVGNDINENCELTHIVRYNHQLGLDAEFLCQDVTEPDFLENLLGKINGKEIDVVCGGPPCQSFSLAGKRKKFDKKDDLFSHYLSVIKVLRPKYFVMENVKGILTKEKGKIKDVILKEINSIIDINELPKIIKFIKDLKKNIDDEFILECLIKKIKLEQKNVVLQQESARQYIKFVESKFRNLTPKIVDYKTSKTDSRVSTIRHGFNILARSKEWQKIKKDIIKEKDFCNIDNDAYTNSFTKFIKDISPKNIINQMKEAFDNLKIPNNYQKDCKDIIQALEIYISNFDDCVETLAELCDNENKKILEQIIKDLRLYKIDAPFVANASNYGVPQNRERVLFIGCRKDQKFISDIPPTVSENEKVSVFEALYDLDFLGNNDEANHYLPVNISKQYNGESKKMKGLLKERFIDGKINKEGNTFSDWSKKGRLNPRFTHVRKPFYVRNTDALKNGEKIFDILHNHKTSNQREDVIERLQVILEEGDYKLAKNRLLEIGLNSNKRNYNLLKPEKQSPTIMTIPDDYIHYNSPRALTVREMARLQSFDDSFVFQGKKSTGGNNRKTEVPQCTLVGNAVPPLMARAVAMEILKNIK